MILEITTGKDNTNVVRKYFKDRSDIRIPSLGANIKLFEDDGVTEIPLYIKKAKPIEEVKVEEVKEDYLESEDNLEFLKETKKRSRR